MKKILLLVLVGLMAGCGKRTDGDNPARSMATTPSYYGGAERKIKDNAFHFAVGGHPKSCDHQLAYTVIEFNVLENTCEPLLVYGPNGATGGLWPGVARGLPEVSADGKVYTFRLRPGAQWSNGEPLTARDFEWSWQRARDPKTNAIYAFLYTEARIATARAVDDHTFVVTLAEPNGVFLKVIPFLTFCPVHRATVEKYGPAWCQPEHFVGNGPFVMVEAKLSDFIRLKRNPNYWGIWRIADGPGGGRPILDVQLEEAVAHTASDPQLHIDRYKKGLLDWLGTTVRIPASDLDELRDSGDPTKFRAADVHSYLRMANAYVNPNVKRKGLDDPRVRRALSLAIDRWAIEKHVLREGNVPTATFIPPGLAGYQPRQEDPKPDCQKARALMAEAGYSERKNFPTYELLFRTDAGTEPKVAAAIAQMWKECLGITVNTAGTQMAQWQPRSRAHKFDITMNAWQGDYPHPQTFAALLQCGNEMNVGEWCNHTYDEHLLKGVRASDPREIQRHYGAMEEIIAKEMPVMPMFFSPRIHALRPEWEGIKGNLSLRHPLQYVRRVKKP